MYYVLAKPQRTYARSARPQDIVDVPVATPQEPHRHHCARDVITIPDYKKNRPVNRPALEKLAVQPSVCRTQYVDFPVARLQN